MLASVLIEYSVKSLNKVFDYIIPDGLKEKLIVGNKVIVPFASKEVEGFVLNIHNNIDKSLEYRSIINIVCEEFYLNDELLKLGKKMSNDLVCNLISCYQVMLPKALKASVKTSINIKYKIVVYLNKDYDIELYINEHLRNKKEIEIINILKNNECDKSIINSQSLRTLIEKGIVLEKKIEVNREVAFDEEINRGIVLTKKQETCYSEIINGNDDKYLLYGVTGSGKTEVYIKLIKDVIKNNKTVICLVPEISLTPQIVARFKSVFKDTVAVFHSSLSEGEKYDEYRRIASHKVSVVVGARSAIFTPLENIGLIIIDECQSSTYKQENNPKYNAIDIAFERIKYHNAKCVLGSATPTLEQFARGKKGVFKLVELKEKVSGKNPKIEIVDMLVEAKKHNYIISESLDREIKNTLLKKEQVMILLNRRGFSTFLSCSNCGYVYKCPNCDISLIYHKSSNSFSCHYCGYRTVKSNTCPKCHEESIRDLGLGTEKLEEMLESKYNTKVLRMDADTTSRKNAHKTLINEFSSGKYSILVGTQMISKGLNFENVSLVGIINIDSSLSIPDFRSAERTYELISQTAGRASRFNLDGTVIVQTYNKDNYVFSSIIINDYEHFYNNEMNIRKTLKYPPYYYICSIKIISESYELAQKESNLIKKYLDNNLSDSFIILGPSIASIFKLKNKYNFQIMIKYKKQDNLVEVLNNVSDNYTSNKVHVDININI